MDEPQPTFLSWELVTALHRLSLDQWGGIDGMRDRHGLESALGAAENAYFCGRADRSDDLALHAAMIAIARREFDKPGFAALLRAQFLRP